jgi:uncharacterized protein
MKKNGTLFYSPTDLIRFLESPFATWMERLHLEVPSKCQPDEETEEQKLVAKTGDQHEEKYLQKLRSEGRDVCEIQKTDHPLAIKQTLSAINEGREIIYQAHLALPPFRGFADFLVRDGKPIPGSNRYEVWDTKLARKTKPYYLIQLCCYAEMLETIQGVRPQKLRVVLGDNSIPEFRTDDFFYYYRTLKQAFLRQMDEFDPDHPPVPDPRADHGRWSSYAEKYLIEKDHLIQVAGITVGQIKKLNKAGINKVSELVGSRDKSVPKLSRDVMIRLAEQASLQVATRDLRAKAKPDEIVRPTFRILKPDANDPRRGLATLPPSSVGDVFFDMEGFPLVEGGLEYLFGAAHLDKDGKLRFQDWWAHDNKEEKAAFEGFVDWAYARWKADPTMHIYHYAKYEVSALRRLMGRYGTREDEVDNLLRNEVFIDLYQVVRQGLRIGEPSYSIKDVEHLYREKRSGDVTAAGESIVYYANWIESGQPRNWNSSDILRKIRDYNKDDCDSLVLLIDWLRNQQKILGIVYIPVRINLPESETKVVDPLIAARIELANRLRMQIPENVEERKKDADKWLVQEMLSHLIEFHRRENKPVWWRMFDRHALTADELKEDINCLGDLALDSNPPIQVKKSLVFTYSFDPNQDNKIREGDRVILSHDLSVKFTVEAFDPEGRIQLKISVKMLNDRLGGRMPKTMSLIPDEFVNPSPIPEAIVDVATKWDRTKAVPENLRRLLLRFPPNLSGKNPADPLAKPNEDIGAAAVRIVTDMQNSVLCIQGPPGCGKTTTASGVIVKLLKTSKNIGITSNSHKAIINLLSACNDKLAGKLQGIKAGGDGNDPIFTKCPGLVHVGVSGDAASQFGTGLIAGTAWLFARDDMVNKLDYLFVDEAGQVSLANLAGMSRCARNVILMGDQMQLEQPIQGSHPGESGMSVLNYYLMGHATIPDKLGLFLGTSFRMHPNVCQFISEMVYDGRLQAAPENKNRALVVPPAGGQYIQKPAGIIFSPVEHDGNTQGSEEEVERIKEIVNELLGRTLFDKKGNTKQLELGDILFVAPYNLQVRLLKSALPQNAKVGSVDKFQGQEAPIVIASMCSSAGEDGPRGLEFLLDKNRINVAISRAQTLAIVVGDPRIASASCSSVADMERLNLFCRLQTFNDFLAHTKSAS